MRKALLWWGTVGLVLTSACATLGMAHFKEPVVTFKDVNVEELAKSDLELPKSGGFAG